MFVEFPNQPPRSRFLAKLSLMLRSAFLTALISLLMGSRSDDKSAPARELEAQRFVVKDAAGRARSVFGVGPEGSVSLELFDARGVARGWMTAPEKGGVAFSLADENQTVRLWLCIDSKQEPYIILRGADGTRRLMLTCERDGAEDVASIHLLNKKEEDQLVLVAGSDGKAYLQAYGAQANGSYVTVGTDDKSPPRIEIRDPSQQRVVVLGEMAAASNFGLTLRDANGPRITLGFNGSGKPSLQFPSPPPKPNGHPSLVSTK